MTQFYIVEIQQYPNGDFGHIVHYAFDEDPNRAREKADSKFYEVLSACAISELPLHSAILFSTEGFPIDHKCYKHEGAVNVEPEVELIEEVEGE